MPPGFHVTTAAYRRFVEADGLRDRIVAAASKAVADRPETWDTAAAEIATLIAGQSVPDDVAEELTASCGIGCCRHR